MKKINFDILKIQIVYIIIIVMLLFSLMYKSSNFVILSISLFLVTFSYSIYVFLKETKDNNKKIKQISNALESNFKDNLFKFDIPICLLKEENNIIWENIACEENISKENINEVFKYFNKDNKRKSVDKIFENNKRYKCFVSNINISKENITMITFIDKTKELELEVFIEDTKVTSGIIFIDNYEETLQGLEEVEKAILTSKLDKLIKTWISENKGIVVNLEKDKYLVIVEKQYINKMEKEKFEILEKVRNISNKTNLPITVSVGLSNNEKELVERYEASHSALDIALGRGGDQVVVKRGNKFDLYGGINVGIEKTSKVKARTVSSSICNIINKSEVVYIMGHKNTDLDALGAAIGIYKLCLMYNKKAYIVVDSKYNNGTKSMIKRLSSLEKYKNAFVTKDNLKKFVDLNYTLFVVDTHKPSYTISKELINGADTVVVIDHHRRGTEFVENAVLSYHELYASSACELVTELLMYVPDFKLDVIEAEALYAGILLDTKNYTFKTGVRTFEVSAYLRKFGIDISSVKSLFKIDFDAYLAKTEIVRNAEFIDDTIAISICEEKTDDDATLTAQVADELLNINNVEASFVLCKIDSVIMISGRSNGDINVQTILEKLGGGGHITFAGTQILGISILEAKEKLLDVIYNYLES